MEKEKFTITDRAQGVTIELTEEQVVGLIRYLMAWMKAEVCEPGVGFVTASVSDREKN